MANEKKSVPLSDIDREKQEKKAKRENERNSLRAAAAKKPRKSIKKFFKDARAEFKKVVWPTPKQVVNNTAVVLTAIVVSGLAIWGLDSLFNFALRLLLQL